ncbi:MAG: 5'/3'-nucleotidase SurE [bacterium]
MTGGKPKILLSNDDGINAPGLAALYQEMKQVGDVVVVAPDSEKSAVGHAITLSDPLRVWNFEKNGHFFGYAVNGTPADCVKIAYWALLKKKPDLVVSGINLGSNAGINAIYSGTVSAATEGTILEIPSFAISLTTFKEPDFSYAAKFARRLSAYILENGLPSGTFLNVNVPPGSEDEIAGVQVTRQGRSNYHEHFDKRVDPQHRVYYWLTGKKIQIEQESDVDENAILNKMVSITPMHYDLTNYDYLDQLRSWEIMP